MVLPQIFMGTNVTRKQELLLWVLTYSKRMTFCSDPPRKIALQTWGMSASVAALSLLPMGEKQAEKGRFHKHWRLQRWAGYLGFCVPHSRRF